MITQKSNLKTQSHNFKVKTDLRQRSYYYSIEVIKFIATLPENQACRILSSQLLRSATSIGANIIEAKSSSSKKDFIKFYEIALKSANETTYWLGLLKDAIHINSGDITGLIEETDELCKIIAASVLTMKNKNRL